VIWDLGFIISLLFADEENCLSYSFLALCSPSLVREVFVLCFLLWVFICWSSLHIDHLLIFLFWKWTGSTVLQYVNMVCAALRHSIPKSVVYCQVRESKRSLLDHFFTELGGKEVRFCPDCFSQFSPPPPKTFFWLRMGAQMVYSTLFQPWGWLIWCDDHLELSCVSISPTHWPWILTWA